MGDMINFTESSDLNGTAHFTLTCISTGGPATNVTWTRDSPTSHQWIHGSYTR